VGSRNASEGNFWFPCTLTALDNGVAVLRVNVVPDATYSTPAAVFTLRDGAAVSLRQQTPRACGQFAEADCVLPADDNDFTADGATTALADQWAMLVPQPGAAYVA
jgi:hypothetical protein